MYLATRRRDTSGTGWLAPFLLNDLNNLSTYIDYKPQTSSLLNFVSYIDILSVLSLF